VQFAGGLCRELVIRAQRLSPFLDSDPLRLQFPEHPQSSVERSRVALREVFRELYIGG
jgi:hypothetical protein